MPTTTRCTRPSSPPSSANCSTDGSSPPRPRPAWPSSSLSRAGTTPAGAIQRKVVNRALPTIADRALLSGKTLNTIHVMDERMFEEIDHVIQAEPPMGESPEILGHLAAIGIVKGQSFEPDERMQGILESAASAGSVIVKALVSKPRDDRALWYPGESYWQNAFPGGAYTWMIDGVTLHDFRSMFHFYATGITPAMAVKAVGKGSQYAFTYRDVNGDALDGGKTYKVTVPADPPAKDFWSFTLYDN